MLGAAGYTAARQWLSLAGMGCKRKASTALNLSLNTPLTSGSRFVDCPVCGRSVALQLVNAHLDTDCRSHQTKTRKTAAPKTAPTARSITNIAVIQTGYGMIYSSAILLLMHALDACSCLRRNKSLNPIGNGATGEGAQNADTSADGASFSSRSSTPWWGNQIERPLAFAALR